MHAYVGWGGTTPRILDYCTIWRSVQLRAPDKEIPMPNHRGWVGSKVGLDVNPKFRFRNPNSNGSINGKRKRIYLFSKASRIALGPTKPLIHVLLGRREARGKRFSVVEPEGKRPVGRLRSRWECNAEISLQEIIWDVVWDWAMCHSVATSGTQLPTHETHLSLRTVRGIS